jgi:hypothetical protein
MTDEQDGVSPAAAGGAPAPIPEVPPHPNYVDNAVAGALTDMYGFLPLDVRYSAAAAARAVVECWTRSRPVPDVEILTAAEPDPRDAEIERLRSDALLLQQHLQRAHGLPDDEVTGEYVGVDFSRTMVDGLRDGKERAERDLERLREHSAARFRDLCAALETDPSIERWDSVLHGVGAAIAERDRLRAEFEGIRGALRAANILIEGTRSERDRLRAKLDFIAEQAIEDHVIEQQPAEPRRWHVGDPEPEIGTTVRTARGGVYTRLKSGYWHRIDGCHHDDPNSCAEAGYSWEWLMPLVEVVGTDG